jgi:hypothetical protein
MASIERISETIMDDQAAWNEAHDRLHYFLKTFLLNDHAQVSRLALKLLDEAREIHRKDPSQHPTPQTMIHAQKRIAEWLAVNLEARDKSPAQIFASGYTALLLSDAFRTASESFLGFPVPEELRQSMRQTLLVTGPDLNISSMTPRPLDYGPMLDLAKQTWHRWKTREILIAALFWTAIYFLFYWWFCDLL